MKSITVSVAWPAWLLGHNPANRIIVSSYAQSLADKLSIDTRLILEQDWYKDVFPKVKFSKDQNEKHKFITTKRGFRLATSTGGSVTGEGGNFLIVDDIHNPIHIRSKLKRNAAINWFSNTFSSRLDDKKNGVFVIVMQRLHNDDLTGYLIGKGGWEILSLPAICEESTNIGFNGKILKIRQKNDILHEKRENKKQLDIIKSDLGTASFLAQYQQNPVSDESSIIKLYWFKRYRKIPDDFIKIIQSWDTAIKGLAHNDYSVCTTWGEAENGYYLLDIVRKKLEYPDLKKVVLKNAMQWEADIILIEDKASGQSLIQDLRHETKLPIIPIMPKLDKVTRMATVSSIIESGNVFLPQKSIWLADYEEEIMQFPSSAHDDQIDSTSQFLNWTKNKQKLKIHISVL